MTTKTLPSPTLDDDPYRSQNEWRAAQKHLIDQLKIGDRLVYVRLYHVYDAGAVTQIDHEKQAVFTDLSYEFVFNVHRNRYVLRGDPHVSWLGTSKRVPKPISVLEVTLEVESQSRTGLVASTKVN